MDDLLDLATFRAERFAPRLPEESQVNPEVYGAELSWWLATELAGIGVVTTYPAAEDWGWYLDFTTADGARFSVHCGNVDGARDRWFLQLRRFGRKRFGRDKPAYEEAHALVAGIEQLLRAAPEVLDLEWSGPALT